MLCSHKRCPHHEMPNATKAIILGLQPEHPVAHCAFVPLNDGPHIAFTNGLGMYHCTQRRVECQSNDEYEYYLLVCEHSAAYPKVVWMNLLSIWNSPLPRPCRRVLFLCATVQDAAATPIGVSRVTGGCESHWDFAGLWRARRRIH